MMDHDEMKSGLLQDLIEKLMEMKDPSDHKPDMGVMGHDAMDKGEEGDEDDKDMDPKAKLAMLEIKAKPEMGDDEGKEDDEQDMHKALGPDDFMSMRKKQMGL